MKKNKDEEKTELRILREESGLSMEDAIRKTGTSKSTLCSWEWGNRRTPPIALAWVKLFMEHEQEKNRQKK